MPPVPSTLRWTIATFIALLAVVLTAHATVRVGARNEGIQHEKIEALEQHAGDTNVHLSIHAAVQLEKRLGSLEGSIKALNATIESRMPETE